MRGQGVGGRFKDAAPLVALAASLAVLAWALGFVAALRTTRPSPPAPVGIEAPHNWDLYGETWTYVDREFYWPRPSGRLVTRGAIEGMLESLDDPYAALIERRTGDEPDAQALPAFVTGIGAWIEPVTTGAQVLATVDGSPADQSELVPGDVIVAADGKVLAGSGLSELLDALSADAAELDLVVLDSQGAGRVLGIETRPTTAPRVSLSQPVEGVLYAKLPSLGREALREWDEAIEDLPDRGYRAMVLDLRDNPGGDLDSLALFAGRLLDGPVWLEVTRDGREIVHDAVLEGTLDPPIQRLVVLTNGGTAGTAEMLAGALHDGLGAQLLGGNTFGKGSIQGVREINQDWALRLTVARWRTPDGTEVDGQGLVPDVLVEGRGEQLEAATRAARDEPGD